MTEMLELSGKNVKVVITKMFQQATLRTLETNVKQKVSA